MLDVNPQRNLGVFKYVLQNSAEVGTIVNRLSLYCLVRELSLQQLPRKWTKLSGFRIVQYHFQSRISEVVQQIFLKVRGN